MNVANTHPLEFENEISAGGNGAFHTAFVVDVVDGVAMIPD